MVLKPVKQWIFQQVMWLEFSLSGSYLQKVYQCWYLFSVFAGEWLLFALFVEGNYYGTPRPVHISAETPPITYQEHRSLLRNFRTRSKSLSNLEKAAAQVEHGDEELGLPGKYRLATLQYVCAKQ